MNIISNAVSPNVLSQTASLLGSDQNTVKKALEGAVPGLMSVLLGATDKPNARQAFSTALSQQDPDFIDNIGSVLGKNPQNIADKGGEMLSSIVGGGQMGVFSSKLKEITGLPAATAGTLTGLAGSLIMGGLGKAGKQNGLDANGVLNLLSSEKSDVATALPADFAETFRIAGLLDPDTADMAMSRESAARVAHADPVEPVGHIRDHIAPAPVKSSIWRWLVPLAVILGGLWLLSGMFGGSEEATMSTAPAPATEETASSLIVNGTDLGAEMTGALESLTGALANITDAGTATTALPDLNAIQERLTGIGALAADLPADASSALGTLVSNQIPGLEETITELMGNSAIADVIGPVLSTLTTALRGFTS